MPNKLRSGATALLLFSTLHANGDAGIKALTRDSCKASVGAIISQPEVIKQYDPMYTAAMGIATTTMPSPTKVQDARLIRQKAYSEIKSLRAQEKKLPAKEYSRRLADAKERLIQLFADFNPPEVIYGADGGEFGSPVVWSAAASDSTVELTACTKGGARVCFYADLLSEEMPLKARFITSIDLSGGLGKAEIVLDLPLSVGEFSQKYLLQLAQADKKGGESLNACLRLLKAEDFRAVAEEAQTAFRAKPSSSEPTAPGRPQQKPTESGIAQ
jgi:hypothetical protein